MKGERLTGTVSPEVSEPALGRWSARIEAGDTVSGWRPFVLSFLLVFGLTLTWVATNPMVSAPDEDSHMVRAAAAAQGDVRGVVGPDGVRRYLVPASLVINPCFAFDSERSAACLRLIDREGKVYLPSSAVQYPSAYYFVVGWPSRLFSGVDGLYGMRVVSAAVFSALIALGMTSLRALARPAPAYVGFAVAATPMVWFLGGSLNPAGVANAAALATWCGGWGLVARDDDVVRRPRMWRAAVPLCILLLMRRDSLVWGGLIVATLAFLLTRDRFRTLIVRRASIGWAALVALCVVVSRAGAAEGVSNITNAPPGVSVRSASKALGSMQEYLEEVIGVLGWLDTQLPAASYLLWIMVLGAMVAYALGIAPRRLATAVVLVAVVLTASIMVVGAQRFPYFQGRYAIPYGAGVPLLAGFGIAAARAPFGRRQTMSLLVPLAIVHLLAFYQQYRRYAHSGRSTWWVFEGARWQPYGANFGIFLAFHLLLLLGLFGWWAILAGSGQPDDRRSPLADGRG